MFKLVYLYRFFLFCFVLLCICVNLSIIQLRVLLLVVCCWLLLLLAKRFVHASANHSIFHFFAAELAAGRFEPDVLLSLEHCNDDDDVVICVVDNCD